MLACSSFRMDIKANIPVLVLVLLVDAAHESSGGRQNFIDEDEDGLLGGELDALADDVDKLAYSQVCGDKILLLVDGCDVTLLDLLANNLLCLCQHDGALAE